MKKTFAFLLATMLVLLSLSCCGKTSENKTPASVRLGGLKGPTTMGMVKLLDDAEKGLISEKYEFTMAATADELTPKLIKNELDILAVPANLASVLYNNSEGAVQTIAINTLGVVYIVEKGGNTIKNLSDLKGLTVYATGKGSTPEYALSYLLGQYGLDIQKDVNVEWKNEPAEVIAQISAEKNAVAMIPQPFVTVAQSQIKDLRIAVNMSEVWNSLQNGSKFITAVIIVRKEFAKENPEAVKKFLENYNSSNDYVNNNAKESSELIEKYGIVKAPVAEKAIPFCNMVCITGNDMKTFLSGYLSILFSQNPKAVGGNLPDDEFYLIYE